MNNPGEPVALRGLLEVVVLGAGLSHSIAFAAALMGAAPGADRAVPSFQKEVLPLLQAKCVRCHGSKVAKADLNLTSLEGIRKGGESGPVVVSGKPDESVLFERVHKGEMPPEKKDRLTAAEVELLKRWISGGASAADVAAATPLNQHDVLPILLRRCTVCHGRNQKEGGLDLRTPAALRKGGRSGPAIVVGDPEASLLIRKVRAGLMPPAKRLIEAAVKPIEKPEIEVLARWIAAGAPEAVVEPDVATTAPDPLVAEKDRQFWAFQPPRDSGVPRVRHAEMVRNPIDAFLLQRLEAKGLSFAPEADRATLIRRVSFDLTGLPPDPQDVRAFVADASPHAYEKLVDRLLASPRYGERWARRWLDLAGYADSEGKREQDLPRHHAWRYRDYVIRACDADKPYDRFLVEQIAGDELVDYERAPEITQEICDDLVATAFLRLAPDPTWANVTGLVGDRLDVMADEIDVLGSTVMGLTIKCARCHSHKFDPIPQRDYYRLAAVFKGAWDEYDWMKPDIVPGIGPISTDVVGPRLLPYVTTAERKRREAVNGGVAREIAEVQRQLKAKADAVARRLLEERLARLPAVLHVDLRTMLATPAEKRDAVQRYLAGKFEQELRVDPASDSQFAREKAVADEKVRSLRSRLIPEPKIHALWDRGEPSPTYILKRGDPQNPGKLVGPGPPSVLTDGKTPFVVAPPWKGAKQTGRRLAFARWLTKPDHPLTARVEVNRMWKHHFGAGIVASLGNFGKTGTSPTHPELLDWLAREFVQSGWRAKPMHRLMVTSRAYRQGSAVAAQASKADSTNALISRMPMVRLDAESLYDSILLASGRLEERRFGPPDPVEARDDGLATPKGTAAGWRRMIYVQQMRKRIATHLENFDFPQMNPNCIERRDSTVAPQALHLMNNGMVEQLADAFAGRVLREAGSKAEAVVERAHWLALSRAPTTEERAAGVEAIRSLSAAWKQASPGGGDDAANRKALATYCHAILNSAAFLYVD